MYGNAYKHLIDAQQQFYKAAEAQQLAEILEILETTGDGELDIDDAIDMLVRNSMRIYRRRYRNFPGRCAVDTYIDGILDPSERA